MGYNVLIVDDSMIIRSMVAKTLKISGLDLGEIHYAPNGQQGLDIVQNQEVDVVFADINMPVMDGVQMVAAMAEQGLLQRIPVVIVSTERNQQRIDHLKALGVTAYLKKPFMPEDFKATVENLLANKDKPL
jgi:two-component system chemotaxis response regulator CheY